MRGLLLVLLLPAALVAAEFNVRDYGARGDGTTFDTVALQAAVDACAAAGGGEVVLPAGRYLCGSLLLKSQVHLLIRPEATLLGGDKLTDYPTRRFLSAADAVGIQIRGGGTIDGRGEAWWEAGPAYQGPAWRGTPQFGYRARPRPQFLYFQRCRELQIRDVKLIGSPSWTIHLQRCQQALIQRVTIRNPLHGPNTDGIDLNSCQDVQVRDCDIITGDDGVVLKSNEPGRDHPSARIEVSGCRIWSACNALKIGTETHDDFSAITFRDCYLYGGSVQPQERPLSGLAIESVDGSHLRQIVARDLTMHNLRAPIFIRLGHRGGNSARTQQVEPRLPGTIREVLIERVTATDCTFESSITGIPGHPVEGVTLRQVDLGLTGGGGSELVTDSVVDEPVIRNYPEAQMFGRLPAVGLYARHVRGLRLEQVNLRCAAPDARPRLVADNVADLLVDGLTAPTAPAEYPLIWLLRPGATQVVNSPLPPACRAFAAVEGTPVQQAGVQIAAPAGTVALLPPGGLLNAKLPRHAATAPGLFRLRPADLLLTAPMVLTTDPTAPGGGFVQVPLNGGRDTGSGACRLEVSTPGRYAVWLLLRAPDGESDSLSFSLGDRPPVIHDATATGPGWTWNRLRDRREGQVVRNNAVTWELPAGEVTVRLRNREAGTAVAAVVLAREDLAWQPPREQ
ncbi:MAG: right-handed parallel beta-helix repeat-containing protein [Fimbriimonadaceae bacterium]|nr:right-handed parallel beta-helix repeat-containing protein [Fimbriimonadaceae bacterium]